MQYVLQRSGVTVLKIGYARVSTTDQNLEIQIKALEKAGCEMIFKEKISGAKKDRPELEILFSHLRAGDILIVTKLDRAARSTRHLLEIVDTLKTKKAFIKSLGEPWADTNSPAGKMIITIFAGVAEFEKDLIRDRTSTGRKHALKKGVKFGRPHKLTKEQKFLIEKLIKSGSSIKEVANSFGVDRSTIYRMSNS